MTRVTPAMVYDASVGLLARPGRLSDPVPA
jgi:hypothetical protein